MKKGMRGMQFLAYHFNFMLVLQREMYIASWYFLLWYCTGSCTGQACLFAARIFMRFANILRAFGVQFSMTDWQSENSHYCARIFRSIF
jgi:hypothetical protein